MEVQNLFGEPLTTGSRINYSEIRQKAINKARESASEAFQIEYRNFVLKFAETHDSFTTEQISAAYRKAGLPLPLNKELKPEFRASGGIIQSLVRLGHLVCIGTEISPTRKSDIKTFRKGL